MKFKIGDKVEFTDDRSDYVPIGSIGIVKTIDEMDEDVPYFIEWIDLYTGLDRWEFVGYVSNKHNMAWASEEELKLVK